MKPGDLVRETKAIRHKYPHRPRSRWGVILEVVFDYVRGRQNGVYKIWWDNGDIGNNVWDYDLEPYDESG